MSEELKPCPKCKTGRLQAMDVTDSDAGGYYPAKVLCQQCRFTVCGDLIEDSAIAAWNARADAERIDALEVDVRRLRPLSHTAWHAQWTHAKEHPLALKKGE